MGTDSRSFLCCFNLSSALLDLWSFAIASLTGRFACSVDLSKAFSDFSSARLLNIDLLLEEWVGSLQSSILNYPVEFFLWISSISSISLWFWLYCSNRFLQSSKSTFSLFWGYKSFGLKYIKNLRVRIVAMLRDSTSIKLGKCQCSAESPKFQSLTRMSN